MVSWDIGSIVASESALKSAGTLLSWVRAPPPACWPDGGPESLRSPYCGLAMNKNQKLSIVLIHALGVIGKVDNDPA
ncbi:hypothetical protein PoB_002598900 [Plakobranchus ocellatus]|uniref:Uncharacterized protein n=1 Tax=Plakobranchus ocellatus TaxID=259542 RepID=A0AAV3ZYM4_9GAST|nr:hypothetical protein PoB_002598900 [Plakobranchus ocellatus]